MKTFKTIFNVVKKSLDDWPYETEPSKIQIRNQVLFALRIYLKVNSKK